MNEISFKNKNYLLNKLKILDQKSFFFISSVKFNQLKFFNQFRCIFLI